MLVDGGITTVYFGAEVFYCAWKLNEVRKSPDLIPEDTSRHEFHSALASDSRSALMIFPLLVFCLSALAATEVSGVLCLKQFRVLCMVG